MPKPVSTARLIASVCSNSQSQVQLRHQTMQGPLKSLAGTGARFTNNPVGGTQILVCKCFLTCKRVVRATEHHQLILTPGQQLQIRVIQFTLNQAQVQLKLSTRSTMERVLATSRCTLAPGCWAM